MAAFALQLMPDDPSVRVLNERVLSLQSAPTQASDEPARRRTKRRDRNSKRQHEPANGVQERE